MKIKAKWGFIGDAKKLGAESSKVVTGQVFDKVDDEYGHTLIGKGLAEELVGDAKPAKGKTGATGKAPGQNKQTSSTENK